jgi:hypothetical protein
MQSWRKHLKYDPLQPLLASSNEALQYFVRCDLLDEHVGPVRRLWHLPAATRILRKQSRDGSWPRAGVQKHPAINYELVETWRQLRFLVESFGFTREHPQAAKAAEFIFSCQTPEGDLRGILADQFATYYTGAIMALLIQAGYAADPRIKRGFQWLLTMRQDDGGWTIPILTHKLDRQTQYRLTSEHARPLEPDRTRPSSHNWTGMVLRAFAVHPRYRHSEAALHAARLLKSRFFQRDAYTSYQSPRYWVRFDYPFWWNNLVTALDSLSLIGLKAGDPDIQRGLTWLIHHQGKDGLWKVSYASSREKETRVSKVRETRQWVTLAICRIFRRFFN